MKPGTNVVYKYVWPGAQDVASFDIPHAAEILCAREQGGNICIWARVVIGREIEKRWFILCGTGHEAPNLDCRYVGTAFINDGMYVFHVFEMAKEHIQ